jgi:hypothetical protein
MGRRVFVTALIVFAGLIGVSSVQAQSVAPAQQAVTAPTGPRITAPLPRFEAQAPQAAPAPAYLAAASADLNDTHTITFTTLGLVLAAIVAIILLA